jgi:YVTN family beta-propeller protein
VDLDALTAAGPKLITGNMGSVGYMYQQTSGMTLSHDGATLVTCDSFDNTLSVIDTATWTVLTAVAVGGFPVRALFAEDDGMIYVSHRNDDTIGVVRNLGSSSAMVKTINVGDYPYEMVLDPNLDRLYVLNFYDKNVGVVDLGTSSMVHTLALPNSPGGLAISKDGNYLFVPTGTWSLTLGPGPKVSFTKTGEMSVINGLAASISYQVPTGLPPAMLAFNGSQWLSAFPSPQGDGLLLFWQIFYPKNFF